MLPAKLGFTFLQGDYDKAVEYFGRCYEICSRLDNAAALYSARVQYGIAKGHQFMGDFSALATDQSASSLQKLVVWKDARVVSTSEVEEEGEDGEGRTVEDREGSGEESDRENEREQEGKQEEPNNIILEAEDNEVDGEDGDTGGGDGSCDKEEDTAMNQNDPPSLSQETSAEATAEHTATDPDIISVDNTPT